MDLYYEDDGLIVRNAVPDDVFKMELCDSDVKEIWASHNHTPKDALKLSMQVSSICFTVEDNGEILAMFGISANTLLGNKAVVWLLSSERLKKRSLRFIKHSKKFVGILLDYYPYLENWVYSQNKDTIRWLQRLGATIKDPQPYGVNGELFSYFYFSRN